MSIQHNTIFGATPIYRLRPSYCFRSCGARKPDHALTNKCVLEASYQMSLFIAKSAKNLNIGENLIKPSRLVFHKTVHEKVDKVSFK